MRGNENVKGGCAEGKEQRDEPQHDSGASCLERIFDIVGGFWQSSIFDEIPSGITRHN